jgi:hypothetical protein
MGSSGEAEGTGMSDDGGPARSRELIAALILLGILLLVCGSAPAQNGNPAGNSPANAAHTGTLVDTHSDKRVVQTGRWYVVRQFTVDFSVHCSNQNYCGEVTTTVINEVDDLVASKGQPVELLDNGKDIDVTLKSGRRIRAHQVSANKCAQN